MSEYITKTYGPGDIAALPPTIGMTSRAPTIGAEDVGHPIAQAFPFHQQALPGATRVEAAGMRLPVSGLGRLGSPIRPIIPRGPRHRGFGLGTNGNGTVNGNGNGNGATPDWMLPVGIGLVLGGLYVMFAKKQESGGIFANMGAEPTCNACR